MKPTENVEKNIVVPEGMLKAAVDAVRDRSEFGFYFLDNKDDERIVAQTRDTLEAALRWLSENPPPMERFDFNSYDGEEGMDLMADGDYVLYEDVRRMFLATESVEKKFEVPELVDLIKAGNAPYPSDLVVCPKWNRPHYNMEDSAACRAQEDMKATEAVHAKTCIGKNMSDNALANNMRQLCSKLCDVVDGWQQKCLQYEGTLAAQQEEIEQAARLKSENRELLRKLHQRELENWKSVCASDVFQELKHGRYRDILTLLSDGEISVGKAAEAIAERSSGIEPFLPEWSPPEHDADLSWREKHDKVEASLNQQIARLSAPASEFMKFLCGFLCVKCAAGKPVLKNSVGFWSHQEEGNCCRNHSIYEAYEEWKTARTKP